MKQTLLTFLMVALLSLWAPEARAAATDVPAAPTELELDFPAGSLTGIVAFKAPGKTVGGADLSGWIDYRILANGTVVRTDRVFYLSTHFAEVTVPKKGDYEFQVILSNKFGDAPAATISGKIGYTSPAAPRVKAEVEKGTPDKVKLSWEPVDIDIDGDNLTDEVTYRIIRFPGEVELAKSIKETTFYDTTLSETTPAAYLYGVFATCNEAESEEGSSNIIKFGHIVPPYSEKFDDELRLLAFNIVDGDQSGNSWEYYNGEVKTGPSYGKDCNDWLITPPVRIEKGKYYRVSVDIRVAGKDYPGKFELMAGDANDPASLTTTVIPLSTVTSETGMTYSGVLKLDGNGTTDAFLGLHALSDKDSWWLYATNLTITDPMNGLLPAAPEFVKVEAGAYEDKTVKLSVKAPTLDISGNNVASLTALKIYRDGELVNTIANPAAGSTSEWTDTGISTDGQHIYRIVAANSHGDGLDALHYVTVGVRLPAPPQFAEAYETDTPGEVTVNWEAVTTYVDGAALDPEKVTYNIWTIVNGQDLKIMTGIKETTATFQIMANPDEEQLMWQFGVTAENAAGENLEAVMTQYTPVGLPYETPYADSFTDLECAYPYVFAGSDYLSYWDNASDSTFPGIQTQDGDNGMLVMHGSGEGASAYLSTGKISLAGLKKPMLTFWLYNHSGEVVDNNVVDVFVNSGKGFDKVKSFTLSDFAKNGWNRAEVALDDYAGKSVQFQFDCTTNAVNKVLFDNLLITDRYTANLTLTSFETPRNLKPGSEYTFNVNVANNGLTDARDFEVVLYSGSDKMATKKVDLLESDNNMTVAFPYTHPVEAKAGLTLKAEILFDADEEKSDNAAAPVTLPHLEPGYPVVSDLSATFGEDPTKVTLTWSAPEITSSIIDDVTEDFESHDAWTQDITGWTNLDRDRNSIYGFSNWIQLPEGAPQPGDQAGWWIVDSSYAPIVEHFTKPTFYGSHSGKQYAVSGSVYSGEYVDKMSDDWLVSPELSGEAQTITFWAKSFLEDALEKFEFLVSSTAIKVGEFSSIKTVDNVPFSWTQYSFDIPEGSKYFAIRSRSRDCFMLMVDDVCFTTIESPENVKIAGYNIYRDGERLNAKPVAEPAYADVIANGSKPEYKVTVVYDGRGESGYSNAAKPVFSGITLIEADAEAEYYNLQGIRVAQPAPGMILIRKLPNGRTDKVLIQK